MATDAPHKNATASPPFLPPNVAIPGRREVGGLITVCAWCGRVQDRHNPAWWFNSLRWDELLDIKQGRATHGICPDCEAQHFPDQPVESSGGVRPIPGNTGDTTPFCDRPVQTPGRSVQIVSTDAPAKVGAK
jgi:hypothetical protein